MPCACRQPQTPLSRPPPLFAQCCLPLGVFPWKRVLPRWCKGNLHLGGKTSNPVQRVGGERRGFCATCSSFGECITNVAMVSSREHFSSKLRAADASPGGLPRGTRAEAQPVRVAFRAVPHCLGPSASSSSLPPPRTLPGGPGSSDSPAEGKPQTSEARRLPPIHTAAPGASAAPRP